MRSIRFWLPWSTAIALLLFTAAYSLGQENGPLLKVGKKAQIILHTDAQVGRLTLNPGRYLVEHRMHDSGHFMHFSRLKGSRFSNLGATRSARYLGPVKCDLQPLGAKVRQTAVHTHLENGVYRVTRVEIKGETAAHLF